MIVDDDVDNWPVCMICPVCIRCISVWGNKKTNFLYTPKSYSAPNSVVLGRRKFELLGCQQLCFNIRWILLL